VRVVIVVVSVMTSYATITLTRAFVILTILLIEGFYNLCALVGQ